MAIVTLKIPDELKEIYDQMEPENPLGALLKQLIRFKDFVPSERSVILKPAIRLAIEKLYGKPIENQDQFLTWLKERVELAVGEVKLRFSNGQVRAMQAEAQAQGRPAWKFIEEEISSLISSRWGF